MGYKPPSYNSVRKMVYVLHKLGLIRKTRERAVKGYPTAFPRTYYEVTPGREGDPAWRNPYAALYYPEKFRKMTEFREIMSSPEEWTRAIRGRRGEKTF